MTPDQFTNQETYLNVSEDHILYVQDWGNKAAKTTYIFLHGGPGSGCNGNEKNLFNPDTMRVLFFDQRGCGKSTPYGSLKNNTTADLIGDITKIADHFEIETFVLVGRSWGSCLALAYALDQPSRVSAIVTGGVYTGNKRDNDFFNNGGWREFFPDVWDTLLARTPEEHYADPVAYHAARMLSNDAQAARESAYVYSELEGSLLRLDDRHSSYDTETFDPVPSTILVHYTENQCFMDDNLIFDNAEKLTMPVWVVQGRYDAVCRPASAYELHKKLPNSHLTWTIAGHSKSDRGNFDVTKTIIESLA